MGAQIIEEKSSDLLFQKIVYMTAKKYLKDALLRSASSKKNGDNTTHSILTLNHPDIKIIQTEEDKTGISIDQIKEINTFVSFYPYQSEFKTVIIFNAQEMTTQAQNALLKSLEDHSETTHYILGVNSQKRLLPTIKSRCTIINFDSRELKKVDKLSKIYSAKIKDTRIEKKSSAKQKTKKNSLVSLTLSDLDELLRQKDLKKRDFAIEVIKTSIEELRKSLSKKKNIDDASKKIDLLTHSLTMVERNTNPRLVLENYLIQTLRE